MTRIAVSGGRDHEPTPAEKIAFLRLWRRLEGDLLLVGDATGVDACLRAWARKNRIDHAVFYARWETTVPRGAAGPNRSFKMLHDGRAEALARFPGGTGTERCVIHARRLGVAVYTWQPAEGEFVLENESAP